ncbi:MAG: acetyl-CoA C-acyltransferase [Magnetococcales bacterium]|nr:acetyl-CoA C-acyltransferase [Magnetococcales bacterium]PPR14906.1 MAG: 3-ketoacyl-CoA thiolase [Pseudomonadota bacterium]
MKNVVIAAYYRSPLTPAHKGSLKTVRADEMAGQVIKELVKKTKVDPAKIEDLIMGCAFPEGEQGFNIARLVCFLAGLPKSVAGCTLNRFCGSSMQAIHNAAGMIQMGAGDAFICAGMENMSRTPMTGFNPMPHPGLFEKMPEAYMGMGETAENVVDKYKLTREEMDEFAALSHKKAAKAREAGNFKDEIIPIQDGNRTISEDECIRPETTAEGLGGLKPAFKEDGSVTAGTSSPLTDGVCAVLVCSEDFAKENKLKPLARIKSIAVAGCDPEIMGIGPVPAAKKALERAGITAADLDVIELNEAFASQSLAVIRDLGLDINKINIDGGAIALGHPLGTTGARITGKAAQLLVREKGKYALATQCIGGGQGIATVLEAI